MSLFSFHGGHSGAYCRHAKDTLAEMIERAITLGFCSYGMTEHSPIYRTEDLYFDQKHQTPAQVQSEFDQFLNEATRLKIKHTEEIDLFVGVETDVIPLDCYVEKMQAIKADARVEYTVGSMHHLAGGKPLDICEEELDAIEKDYGGVVEMEKAYFVAVREMIENLGPTVVGHIDLIRKYRGKGYIFCDEVIVEIKKTLEAVKEYGCILDVNCALARKGTGDIYPAMGILEMAQGMGIGVTLGDDSHSVADVGGGLAEGIRVVAGAGYGGMMCAKRVDDEMVWVEVGLGEI